MNDVAHGSGAPRPTAHRPAVVAVIIPCLDEEAAIARVVISVLAQDVGEVLVVDGGSQDSTAEQATAAGARVIVEPQRGPTSQHGTPPDLLRCELAAVGYREISLDRLTGSDAYLAIFALPSVASRSRARSYSRVQGAIAECHCP